MGKFGEMCISLFQENGNFLSVVTMVDALTPMCILLVFDGNYGVNGKGAEKEQVVDCEFELLGESPCDVECPRGLELPRTVKGSQVSGGTSLDRCTLLE